MFYFHGTASVLLHIGLQKGKGIIKQLQNFNVISGTNVECGT
jgi:hypothetical protein